MYLTWFGLSSVLWTFNIALALYISVVQQIQDVEKYEFRMVMLAYTLPLFVSLLPWTTNSYGHAGGLCWIHGNDTGVVTTWRIITFYGPLWVVIVTNISIYVKIIRVIFEYVSEDTDEVKSTKKLVRRLRLYPLLLIVDYSFATINRVYDFIYPDDPSFILIIIA